VRKTQSEYETQLFKWQTKNSLSNRDDIKIEIKVKSGKVDLYVNTFDQAHDVQNIVQKLPTSRELRRIPFQIFARAHRQVNLSLSGIGLIKIIAKVAYI